MAPAVAVAAASPAFAVSAPGEGCYTMDWGQLPVGTRVGGQTFSTSGTPCAEPPTATVTVNRGGRAGTVSGTQSSAGLYSSRYNGVIDYRGEQVSYPANQPFSIPGVSASNPGLVLNIGNNTTTSVTFTFNEPVSSVQIPIVDITRSGTSVGQAYQYTDTVAFSEPTGAAGDTTLLNRTTATAGQTYSRTGQLTSGSSSRLLTFTTTSSGSISSITVTYTAPQAYGWQFIALQDPSFCV